MISTKKMKEIYDYVEEWDIEQAAENFNIGIPSVRRYLGLYHENFGDTPEEIHEKIETNSQERIIVACDEVQTEEQARQYANVSEDYKTHRIDLNFRPDGTSQYKIAFVPKQGISAVDFEEVKERYKSLFTSYSCPKPLKFSTQPSDLILTVSLFDFHHGKQIWGQESGTADYGIEASKKSFINYISYVLFSIEDKYFDEIVLEIGGDFFNSNGSDAATKKGTPMAEDARYLKTENYAEEMLVTAIDMLSTHCNKVNVVVIPGNHDADRLVVFSHFLAAWYRSNDEVVINDTPLTHKTLRYGTVYLLYTHQMLTDIIPLMASLNPVAFAECHTRIANVGHLHTRKDTTTTRDYDHGIEVVQHPALIPGDSWSVEKGYISSRQGLIRVFHKKFGKLAEFNYEPHFFISD